MRAALLLTRSELRRRWPSLVVLALLVAFAGGVTLTAVAGARRTSSSYDRFLVSSRNHDAILFCDDVRPADVARLRAMPGVAAIGYARQLSVVRPSGQVLAVGGPLDDVLFRDVYRLRIVHGRRVTPGATDEVVVGEPLARENRLHVGDSLPLESFTQPQIDGIIRGNDVGAPGGPRLRLRVVGISRSPIDLSLQGAQGGILLLSKALVDRYGSAIGNFSGPHGGVLLARLTDGSAGVSRFLRQARQVLGKRAFDVDPAALSTGGVQESIDLIAAAVIAFGAIAGAAGLVALGLTTTRQVSLIGAREAPVRDLGLPRRLRAAAFAAPVVLAVVAGAALAMLLAWAASPLLPFGVAGQAEPHPGLHFDALVLVVGAIAIVVVLGAIVAIAGWRAARPPRPVALSPRPSRLTRTLERVGLAPSAAIGVRMALEPRSGGAAVPVRSSLVGAAAAVLGVITVAVFGASLDGLHHSPSAYGRPWDVRVYDGDAGVATEGRVCTRATTRLVRDPDIEAIAGACSLNVTLNGRAIGAFGITSLRGSIEPTVLAGRAPRAPDEIGLGSKTLDALHLDLGDRVTGRTAAGSVEYRVVGRVVVPALSDPQALADGAVLTGDGLDRVDSPRDTLGSNYLVVRFRPGVDKAAAASRIRRMPHIGAFEEPGVVAVTVPLEVERLLEVDRIPFALGAFLVVVGSVAVGHLLVTSVRRRRRDFAVLKSIGFTRRQVLAAVAWQATTVAGFGLLAGLALGPLAGGALWRAAADRVGVLATVDLPVVGLALVAAVTVAIVNLVAAVPARNAARTQPAVTLHSE